MEESLLCRCQVEVPASRKSRAGEGIREVFVLTDFKVKDFFFFFTGFASEERGRRALCADSVDLRF